MNLYYEDDMHEAAALVKTVVDHFNKKGIRIAQLNALYSYLLSAQSRMKKIIGTVEIKLSLRTIATGILTNETALLVFKEQELFITSSVITELQGQSPVKTETSLAEIQEGKTAEYINAATINYQKLLSDKDIKTEVSIPKFSLTKVKYLGKGGLKERDEMKATQTQN